jgi:hypothetical protein
MMGPVDAPEYEAQLGDLETRVDRLRALYDQYFMGIEKLVPSVPHKEVERRIALLRREQPRNTALRFRFQMLLQKYNTYQTYWQRICRQIEEGTYKRDVLRAKKRVADAERRAGPADAEATIAAKEAPKEPQRFKSVEIELDLDLMEAEAPSKPAQASPPAPAAAPPAPKPAVSPAKVPTKIEVPRVALPGAKPAMVWRRAGEPSAPAGGTGGAERIASDPAAQAGSTKHPGKLAASGPGAGAAKGPPPAPIAKPPVPPAKPEPPPAPIAKPPVPPAKPGPPPAPIAKPPVPPAKPGPPPAPIARPAATAPKPPAAAADLSDQRVRELYAKYVEAKRARNESTAGITFESMAKSLRESSDRLKQKHAGRAVDFEIGEKDGKTVIKPIVK